MSSLKQQLQNDLTAAMKSRNELVSSTLRMVLTAVSNEERSGNELRELSDDEVLKVITREAKKRREAATAYTDAGRSELADREVAELGVLEGYLPAQLSDEELVDIVVQAKASVDVDESAPGRSMGAVMKAANAAVAGRAEGGRVAAEVKRQLGV